MREFDDQSVQTFIDQSSLSDEEKKELIEVIPGMSQVERAELILNLMMQRASDDLQELEDLPIVLETPDDEANKIMADYDTKKKNELVYRTSQKKEKGLLDQIHNS